MNFINISGDKKRDKVVLYPNIQIILIETILKIALAYST